MIGSRHGWLEAPYLACPAAVADLGAALVPLDLMRGRRAVLAPGLVRLYGQALGRLGVASREGPPDAAARGLHRLAKHLSEGGAR
jgi:2-keto-3-deoxy-galactonokinase